MPRDESNVSLQRFPAFRRLHTAIEEHKIPFGYNEDVPICILMNTFHSIIGIKKWSLVNDSASSISISLASFQFIVR